MKQKNEILVGAVGETAEIINLKEGQGMQNGSAFSRDSFSSYARTRP